MRASLLLEPEPQGTNDVIKLPWQHPASCVPVSQRIRSSREFDPRGSDSLADTIRL